MNSHDFVRCALQVTTMPGCAVLFDRLVQRCHPPAVTERNDWRQRPGGHPRVRLR